MLGAAQEEWLFDNLRDSTAAGKPWQILGQQVMFAPQAPPGSRVGQRRLVGRLSRRPQPRVRRGRRAPSVKHLVVLTGDVHSAWAYDLARDPFDPAKYDPATGAGAIGTEIVDAGGDVAGGPPPDRLAGAPGGPPAPQVRLRPSSAATSSLDLTPRAPAGRLVVRPDHHRAHDLRNSSAKGWCRRLPRPHLVEPLPPRPDCGRLETLRS